MEIMNIKFFRNKKSINNVVLPVISGILLVLSFPGFDIWPLAWIALIPLFFALKGKNLKQSFLIGLICGLVAYLGFLRWMPFSIFHLSGFWFLSIMVWFLASLYPAFSVGIFCLVFNFFFKNFEESKKTVNRIIFILLIPCFWVALEFIQFKLFKGFPWIYDFIGYTQWNNIRIIQIASFTSVLGVSFLIVLVNLCIYLFIFNKKRKEWAIGLIVLMLCLGYGVFIIDIKAPREQLKKENSLKVSILDGNIDSLIKWNNQEETGDYIANTYLGLNKEAVKENPNLIVWTETAIPWPMEEGDNLIEEALKITAPISAYHMIGMPQTATSGKMYNSVFFVGPDGLIFDSYSKTNLLDFIEKDINAPGPSWFLKIHSFIKDYIAGTDSKPLETPIGKAGVLICNENLYSDYVKSIVKRGAEFLTVVGNDNLTGGSVVTKHHFVVNIFRAIENRRDVVVAVNSGISGSINAYGRIINSSNNKGGKVISTLVEKRDLVSLYNKYGDMFSCICLIFSIAAFGFCIFKKKND